MREYIKQHHRGGSAAPLDPPFCMTLKSPPAPDRPPGPAGPGRSGPPVGGEFNRNVGGSGGPLGPPVVLLNIFP